MASRHTTAPGSAYWEWIHLDREALVHRRVGVSGMRHVEIHSAVAQALGAATLAVTFGITLIGQIQHS